MDKPDPVYNHHCKKILVAGISVIAICTELATIMTIETDKAEKETARWNDKETQQFVQFLVEHKSEGGGNGTFKNKTMMAAAQHIAPYRTMGIVKEAKHMHMKWSTVCPHHLFNDRY